MSGGGPLARDLGRGLVRWGLLNISCALAFGQPLDDLASLGVNVVSVRLRPVRAEQDSAAVSGRRFDQAGRIGKREDRIVRRPGATVIGHVGIAKRGAGPPLGIGLAPNLDAERNALGSAQGSPR